jgi:hypothetical protein
MPPTTTRHQRSNYSHISLTQERVATQSRPPGQAAGRGHFPQRPLCGIADTWSVSAETELHLWRLWDPLGIRRNHWEIPFKMSAIV